MMSKAYPSQVLERKVLPKSAFLKTNAKFQLKSLNNALAGATLTWVSLPRVNKLWISLSWVTLGFLLWIVLYWGNTGGNYS